MKKLKHLFSILCSSLFVVIFFTSCEKFVEVDPPNSRIVTATVYSSDKTATTAIIGIYEKMTKVQNFAGGHLQSVTFLAGLSSDELQGNFSSLGQMGEFLQNSLTVSNPQTLSLWSSAYDVIYGANAVLEGLANSTGVTNQTKDLLEGEAKFIRAFCHFYLVSLWGDVPLITTTDYRFNAVVSRTAKAQVYQQIISDLKDAQSKLKDDYVDGVSNSNSTERTRPNKWVATAFLARVYLYMGDWVNAEAQATAVISNTSKYSIVANLDNVFLKNSTETIWQLMPTDPGFNTSEAIVFIPGSGNNFVYLSSNLVAAFEPGDNRKINWIGAYTDPATSIVYYYPHKYKVQYVSTLTEYSMVFRLAEQYLIRAEARAQQNNVSGAQADINAIRNRAGLGNTMANDKASLLSTVEHERQVEMFTEWGHRWFDLKRTNRADVVLGPIKTPGWQPTDVLYPIPESEMLNNPNLRPQNMGY